MPIYELECNKCHHRVEKLFTCIMNFITEEEFKAKENARKAEHRKKKFSTFDSIDTTVVHPSNQLCEMCGGFLELIPSLPSMQPDKYWAGQMTEAGYVTSGSFLKRFRKQNNLEKVDRSTYEEVQKKQANRTKEHIRKTAKQKHDIIAEEVKHLDLPND